MNRFKYLNGIKDTYLSPWPYRNGLVMRQKKYYVGAPETIVLKNEIADYRSDGLHILWDANGLGPVHINWIKDVYEPA